MLSWIPIVAAGLFIWFVSQKLWVKIVGGIFIYLFLAIGLVIALPVLDGSFSTGDAQTVAEAISENLAITILRVVIDIPMMCLVIWMATRRLQN